MANTSPTPDKNITRLVVFQERGSGTEKIKGILEYGHDIVINRTIDIDQPLPDFIDEPEEFIQDDFSGDLVLSFLKHPDLLDYLATLCQKKNIPLIASGKKTVGAITPFTCCGLGQHKNLGQYGSQFGFPELNVELDDEGKISYAEVVRGASCGATWEALKKIIGLTLDEAIVVYAREVQYLCIADPSAFDPVSGKSSVHYAGHAHSAALKKGAGQTKK